MQRSVGIIGAGAAGLCGARHFIAAGFDVTLYEVGSQVGGMWVYGNDNGRSSAYRTLHINTARDLTAFPDFPFDTSVPPFPNHRDMAKYLGDYADRFSVRGQIRFNTPVKAVRPAPDYHPAHPRWLVETDKGETATHDILIAASGHLTRPLEVAMFRDRFKGEYLHSHYYREPARFTGKRVCIVGTGNSALDIASDICMTAETTTLVARSQPLIIPKLIFGRPFWDTVKPFYKPWVPAWLRARIVKALVFVVHGRMADLGFPPAGAKRIHATSNANIVNHIRYRRVLVHHGIEAIDGQTITFTDRTRAEFDTLIAATGYEIDLDILPKEVVAPKDNALDLYMRMVPPDWRGLYLLGFFNSDSALNWIVDAQAKWLVAHETGEAALPDAAGMQGEIAARKAWVAANFKDTPRHGIEVEHVPYFADLRASLEAGRKRARSKQPASQAAPKTPVRVPADTG